MRVQQNVMTAGAHAAASGEVRRVRDGAAPSSITRILVPVDFTESSDGLAASATALAWRFDASLTFLSVVADPTGRGGHPRELPLDALGRLVELLRDDVEVKVQALTEKVIAHGLEADGVVVLGQPAHAIVEHARRTGTDLIIMGRHDRGVLPNLVVGSVAEQVMSAAPCPVLIVPSGGGAVDVAEPQE